MNSLPVPKTDPTLPELLESFYSGLSVNTLDQYRRGINHFAKYLQTDPVEAFERLKANGAGSANWLVSQYRDAMANAGLKANTVNARLAALRSFIDFMQFSGQIEWHLRVKNLKTNQSEITGTPWNIVLQLIEASKDHPRDHAMVLLMARLGLRRSSISWLNLEDVDFDQMQITFKAKGEKIMTLPIDSQIADSLKDWIAERKANSPALFTNYRPGRGNSRRLSPHGVWLAVRRLGDAVGVKVTPHQFRHAIATFLAANGATVFEIMALLGHDAAITAQRYIDNLKSMDMKQKALDMSKSDG